MLFSTYIANTWCRTICKTTFCCCFQIILARLHTHTHTRTHAYNKSRTRRDFALNADCEVREYGKVSITKYRIDACCLVWEYLQIEILHVDERAKTAHFIILCFAWKWNAYYMHILKTSVVKRNIYDCISNLLFNSANKKVLLWHPLNIQFKLAADIRAFCCRPIHKLLIVRYKLVENCSWLVNNDCFLYSIFIYIHKRCMHAALCAKHCDVWMCYPTIAISRDQLTHLNLSGKFNWKHIIRKLLPYNNNAITDRLHSGGLNSRPQHNNSTYTQAGRRNFP